MFPGGNFLSIFFFIIFLCQGATGEKKWLKIYDAFQMSPPRSSLNISDGVQQHFAIDPVTPEPFFFFSPRRRDSFHPKCSMSGTQKPRPAQYLKSNLCLELTTSHWTDGGLKIFAELSYIEYGGKDICSVTEKNLSLSLIVHDKYLFFWIGRLTTVKYK